jgi:hypothetical protein
MTIYKTFIWFFLFTACARVRKEIVKYIEGDTKDPEINKYILTKQWRSVPVKKGISICGTFEAVTGPPRQVMYDYDIRQEYDRDRHKEVEQKLKELTPVADEKQIIMEYV